MLEEYKDAYDEIEVPKNLIHKTLVLMNEEQGKQKEKKFRFSPIPTLFGLAGTAAVVAIVASTMGQTTNQTITDLVAGETVKEVELSNGHLVFSDSTLISSLETIPTNSSVEECTEKEVELFLEENVQDFEVPKEYTLAETKFEKIYENKEVKNVRVIYVYKYNEQTLEVAYQLKLKEVVDGNSEVNGISCDVWYDDKKSEYGGTFIKGKYIYALATTNASQERFITILKAITK